MLLSIIIPVYNVEKYLDKCIQSVINQTYLKTEIILVDDGSTDSSGYLCDLWAKKDRRISVIHKPNGGLSSARNAGLNIAKGEYIGFVDSDDFIELDMYKTMMDAIFTTKKDIACCGRIIDLWGERNKKEYTIENLTVFNSEEAIKETLLLTKIDVSSCDKIFKKTLFNTIVYPEGKISEDASIIFNLINKSNGIVHVGKPYYHYVYRKNSISKSEYDHKKYDSYKNCLSTQKFIGNNYPKLKRYCKIYCTLVCGCLLQSMEETGTAINKYKHDFKDYKKMFNKGYLSLILEKDISLKLKIKYTFILLNKYSMFLFFKNVFGNV